MANLDFSPLYRSSIGFDRVLHLVQAAKRVSETDTKWPPYNIEKVGDDDYRIVIALAGYGKNDINVVAKQDRLTVSGHMSDHQGASYLHRGIVNRPFKRHFDLADYVTVIGATFENGLLEIELRREMPEELKPRKVEISGPSRKIRSIGRSRQQAA